MSPAIRHWFSNLCSAKLKKENSQVVRATTQLKFLSPDWKKRFADYQVAYTVNDEKTFNREISAFDRIKDNYPKFLLTLDYDNTSINGIQNTNVIN